MINQLVFSIEISSTKVKNANTIFLKIEKENIKEVKLMNLAFNARLQFFVNYFLECIFW